MPAIVGVPKKFVLVAKSGGQAVDLAAFPGALTDVVYAVGNTDIAAVNVTKPDNTEVEVTFSAAGATTLSVTGKNVKGEAVTKSIDIVGEAPTPVVDELDLIEP